MKVIVAEEAGFCFGVKRALRLINQLHNSGQGIQIYGELIHNRTVLNNLDKKGIPCIDSLDQLDPAKKVMIRTHGIPLKEEKILQKREIDYVDATCPLVKKTHKIIEKLNRQKTQIVMVGDRKHPEMVAARSYANDALVINSIEEARQIAYRNRISVVTQTTLNMDFFKEIISVLLEKTARLEIYNTVCSATRVRQEAIGKLAPGVDFVVVIGGKNSSNTRKLFEISQKKNKNTFFFERSDELHDPGFLEGIKNFNSVAITAGASTPPEEIEKVKAFFKKTKLEKESKHG
jgi:4-hydroxy-3-methylbut-2-enyl diphosphate reductase